MAGLDAPERKRAMSLHTVVEKVLEDMDPDNCIEDEYKVSLEVVLFTVTG